MATATCEACGRLIETDADGTWIDPEADGDDAIWRYSCDQSKTFTSEHIPEEEGITWAQT